VSRRWDFEEEGEEEAFEAGFAEGKKKGKEEGEFGGWGRGCLVGFVLANALIAMGWCSPW
jgi:hypothetical protein